VTTPTNVVIHEREVVRDARGRIVGVHETEWSEPLPPGASPRDVHARHASAVAARGELERDKLARQLATVSAERDALRLRIDELEQVIFDLGAQRDAERGAIAASQQRQIERDERMAADLLDPGSELGRAFAAITAGARHAAPEDPPALVALERELLDE
jgi:hypothetical protein